MWGNLVYVADVDGEALRAARRRHGFSQKRTAELMHRSTILRGHGSTGEVVLSGDGMGWITESACLRAVSELENGRRRFKEGHYVYALLAVLDLQPADVGLAPPQPRIGTLDRAAVAAVEALPQEVRGVMFNAQGEALVYGVDDVLYHSDADWSGAAVRDGQAHGLVLDGAEQDFVRAMWRAGEERRRSA
jgi:transcriptional regulator with XRE-family HTH domain